MSTLADKPLMLQQGGFSGQLFRDFEIGVNVFIQETNIRNAYKHTLHYERI